MNEFVDVINRFMKIKQGVQRCNFGVKNPSPALFSLALMLTPIASLNMTFLLT